MHSRRRLLKSGLAALGYGLSNPMPAFGTPTAGARTSWSMPRGFDVGATNPIRRLDPSPTPITIEGLPFDPSLPMFEKLMSTLTVSEFPDQARLFVQRWFIVF